MRIMNIVFLKYVLFGTGFFIWGENKSKRVHSVCFIAVKLSVLDFE